MDQLIDARGVHDPAVIEAMMAEYGLPVYRLALSILRDSDDAQDATQETFVHAANGLDRYQVGTNFKAWLFTITVNTCRMALRRRSARRILQQAWGSIAVRLPHQPSTESLAIRDETCVELWSLVDALDEKRRLVVTLRLAHGLKVSEISQILGVNEKTVYTRLYSALSCLCAQVKMRPEFEHLRDEVQP